MPAVQFVTVGTKKCGTVGKLSHRGTEIPLLPLTIAKSTKRDQMTVTLTANYKEVLNAETVEKIDELQEELYDLQDMLTFIDEYNETAFNAHYEEYVRCGEEIGFDAVDALAAENGIDYIEDCDSRYQGCYHNEADFAESFYDEQGTYVPDGIVVDWEATWERNLRDDFTSCDDGTCYLSCHIFADN